MPALAAHAGVPLERVTGLASAIERTASFAGAAMAGALVAFLGAGQRAGRRRRSPSASAPWSSRWSTRAMRAEQVDERPAGTTYVEELREGWDFLRRDPVLVAMSAMVAVTNLLDLAFSAVLLPVWIQDNGYSVGVLGAYFATWAAASAIGSVVAAWAAERMPRFQVYLWAFLVTGLPRFVLLALGVPLWLVLVSCLVGGFASGFLNPILGAVIYERVPAAVMGRVTTINSALCWSPDAVRWPARRVPVGRVRHRRRPAGRRVRLPRRHHAAARHPGVPAVRQSRRLAAADASVTNVGDQRVSSTAAERLLDQRGTNLRGPSVRASHQPRAGVRRRAA